MCPQLLNLSFISTEYIVPWLFLFNIIFISFFNVVVAVHQGPYMEHVSHAVSDIEESAFWLFFFIFFLIKASIVLYLLMISLRQHSRS